MLVPIILSGGAGTRLWPLSRELYPKQLLPLVGDKTMLQNTVSRLEGISGLAEPAVVCNENHRFMVAEQLKQLGRAPSAIILEPVGRNTAPAVAVAAFQAMEGGEDPLLLVLPADHVVRQAEGLRRVIESAVPLAEQGKLITFGIVPTGPETGYGYIRAGAPLESRKLEAGSVKLEGAPVTGHASRVTAFAVSRFVEKPDLETARSYIDSGDYSWNSGMFMFKASRLVQELDRFAPEIVSACRKAVEGAERDLDFIRLDADAFAACPSDSIDYAVMEKTEDAVVVPLDAGWSDVGSWSALWEVGEHDCHGNLVYGDVLLNDAKNNYLHAEGRMIAAVGLEDHVVVETADAVLVAHRDKVQDVKEIVSQLKMQQRDEAILHRKAFRPWGSYECIDSAERFQVKRITVNPGASLSLQRHHHRAEHWIVVKGTARITKGDEVVLLSENQSTYIPLGVTHRLENPGKIPLELIEVQSGSYLGEDDIERFGDVYGRS
ncbi:MAG: mannose-1-phosphate guanylyltransferase/mannose-6-phosphate isomerase [Desulfuromonas sp.]|uniref:mannose-1-phosphate guanylyltransferase/mannose-6-phosphate isomerase n=1 Tax=Desulfuromonas sp. TaxID=892 RepID=UPI000CAF88A0|nr:mannose-1-phosphate guanylyltransferase/mannose-6-phosphate isomerase [Desulfuromonas sp.]PLX85630.1 MAG: mannose-1-phosphate guanylyltransferase/mannose-6-phosphate isomerase [Desulfuromonas sp.]